MISLRRITEQTRDDWSRLHFLLPQTALSSGAHMVPYSATLAGQGQPA